LKSDGKVVKIMTEIQA